MALAQEVQVVGEQLTAAEPADFAALLNSGIKRFVGWPYASNSGSVIDHEGSRTDVFASLVYAMQGVEAPQEADAISADTVAAVIDATQTLDLESLRAAYVRIAQVKKLKKSPSPLVNGIPITTITLGIIFAQNSSLPLEVLAEELQRLNAKTPGFEWPDMIVVGSTGVINYAVQFPGEGLSGDYLPPAEGATAKITPPWYVVMVVRPTGVYTFNKMVAYLIAHLNIFSPGADLPNWSYILDGTPQIALTISGFQYNLQGELLPVPRQFYNDRYLAPPPLRIESQQGELLSTIRFLPWQDGGVIILRGKLPLSMIILFLGKEVNERGGVVSPASDVQISYVLPITQSEFNSMLRRFQQQSNMVIKSSEGTLVLQKLADEGSSSPFYARIFMGILRIREAVYSDKNRDKFDELYELVSSSLSNTRATAREIEKSWKEHLQKITSGEIARVQGRVIQIDENVDAQLRMQIESFLNSAVRVLKTGMQSLAMEMQLDIGFLFKQQPSFEAGIAALRATDPLLADYLWQTRTWSDRLIQSRNAVEHKGWALPRANYTTLETGVTAVEPEISSIPVTEFARFMFDRLCCFVEELTAHCLQRLMPTGITVTEIPRMARPAEAPERFTLTLVAGGLPPWAILYHATSFEES